MGDQLKNVMIGIFVLAALAIVVFIMLFLHPNLGNEGKTLKVRFSDIDKISVGTRVTFAGKPVGEVIRIDEIDLGANPRMARDGTVYIYELTLALDSSDDVYTTDEITSRTSGLLGEKSVSIMPMPPKEGQKLVLVKDQILYAAETGSVESTLKEFKELSDKVELTLDGFIDAFDQLKKHNVWENIGFSISNIKDITEALDKPEQLSQTIDNFAEFSKNTSEMVINVRKGEGSVGKILVKDDLYLRLSSLLSKAETTLNDVNHYGILFHLDKSWQRMRARRLNLMQQLSSPQEFRNYFNDEMDSILTSLERVSMVLEKDNFDPCCPSQELWLDPEYIKVYGELLRRVAMLEEYLQMYNQQVVDTGVKKTELIINECCN
jgi:phospholipid/cholesterol/gamma-HCH transport system substrate-binding protein